MAQDIMSKFYTILNLPIQEKLFELTKLIDLASPNKELQSLFPQLVSNIFSLSMYSSGWGLRMITCENSRQEYIMLMTFLETQGPMFRLCYKLLSDPQLKYNVPIDVLPQDLQLLLKRGRYPQFYADLIVMDTQASNVVALALNPFDYYILNFALHLNNDNQNKSTWENWNSVYFALACDYLIHFLPADPNVEVLPQIRSYTGKVLMTAPLQNANRPLYSSSLLLIRDMSGLNNQHTASQADSRNEIWRTETVLQIFIDIWMSVDDAGYGNAEVFNRNYPATVSSPEQVRTIRALVKHIHSYSAKNLADPVARSSALRKYARQVMCTRAYHYIKHLVLTWPLDASFRLVLELWLSLIQPWRYTDDNPNHERYLGRNNNQEDGNREILDSSYMQFIAENFPSYTCILQMVLPRFMRLDLTALKNSVMLFRLGKVFSQQHLVPILREMEHAIMENNNSLYSDMSWSNTSFDQVTMNQSNVTSTNRWVAVAKQALSELNMSPDFQYSPIWTENNKSFVVDFLQKIATDKVNSENILENINRRNQNGHRGVWASIKHWLMISGNTDDELQLEECKKVLTYLEHSIHNFSLMFGLNETTLLAPNFNQFDNDLDQSSFTNSSNFSAYITKMLRSKKVVRYMGDPDLMPITSYENTILVRILYQISSRVNELYGNELSSLWERQDFLGALAREVLQQGVAGRGEGRGEGSGARRGERPGARRGEGRGARLSLRRLAARRLLLWLAAGYVLLRLLGYPLWFYVLFLFATWSVFILTKATLKYANFVRSDDS